MTGLSFVSVQSNTAGQVVLDVPANTGAAARSDDLTIGRRVFTVRQAGVAVQPPFGALDAPADGAQVSGSIALGGWALDDLEVTRVQIFRDPVAGEPAAQMFIGTAVFVAGARPDVAQAYPTYPLNNRAGWGFLVLTNMLPNQGNGTFRLYAYADDAEGARTLLGAKTIVVDNATATLPFGAIDTPGQGATVAGSGYLNWGWALTPQPKIIPTDGSTIQVYVDGVPQGNPIYNLFRSDVSGLFPGWRIRAGRWGIGCSTRRRWRKASTRLRGWWSTVRGRPTGLAAATSRSPTPPTRRRRACRQPVPRAVQPPRPPSRGVCGRRLRSLAGPDHGRRAASLTVAPEPEGAVVAQRGDEPARRSAGERRGPTHGDAARARAAGAHAERHGRAVRRHVGGISRRPTAR